MKIQNKPDYLIFADSAKKGENSDFPDISRGWGITIDQTASKPPMEWMNGAFNRIDKNVLYLLQQGVPEWSELVKYPANAIIKYNGGLYTAIAENDNANPATDTTKWKKTQAEIIGASTTQSGVVKLNSSTNSTLETEAATPLAVKQVNDNANEAHKNIQTLGGRVSGVEDKANIANANATSANSNANEAHKNIQTLGGRVSVVEQHFESGGIESRVYSNDKRFYFLVRDDGLAGLFDMVKDKLLWGFRDNYLETGLISTNRIDGLNNYILAMYNQSFNSNGFTKLPNGLVIQWGIANYKAKFGTSGMIQTFYTQFPNSCFLIICNDGGEGVHITSASPISNTQFKCWGRRPLDSAPYADTVMNYMAIGF